MSCPVLVPGQNVRPSVDTDQVRDLIQNVYGLEAVDITELNSYDDRNFHFTVRSKIDIPSTVSLSQNGYVLKILNSLDSQFESAIDAQNALISHLKQHDFSTPGLIQTKDGEAKTLVPMKDGKSSLVRLFEYIPGTILKGLPVTKEIAFKTGCLAGKLDKCCQGFHHPGFDNYKRIWSLTEVPKLVDFLSYLEDPEIRNVAASIIQSFSINVVSHYDLLRKGVIHGDFNEENILLKQGDDGTYHVTSILDYGDSADSYHVFEIAICIAYLMMEVCEAADPLLVGGYTLAGYLSANPLPVDDLNVLKDCICARLVQSLILGSYTASMQPQQSQYYTQTFARKWSVLKQLIGFTQQQLFEFWGKCCEEFGIKLSV